MAELWNIDFALSLDGFTAEAQRRGGDRAAALAAQAAKAPLLVQEGLSVSEGGWLQAT